MKRFVLILVLLLFTIASAVGVRTSLKAQSISVKPGSYEFEFSAGTKGYLTINVSPATGGIFTASGSYDSVSSLTSSVNPDGIVAGSVSKTGALRAIYRDTKGKEVSIDAKWDAKLNTFVLEKVGDSKVKSVGTLRPLPEVGMYEGSEPEMKFNLEKSANPDQMSVTGQLIYAGAAFPMSGTYYIRRNAFTAYAKFSIPKTSKMMSLTADGRILPDGTVRMAVKGAESGRVFKAEANRTGPVGELPYAKAKPLSEPGFLEGSLKPEKSTVETGEMVRIRLNYQLKNVQQASVKENITMTGPSGKIEAEIENSPDIDTDTPRNVVFGVWAKTEGSYKVKVRVTAPGTSTWEASTILDIKAPKAPVKKDGDGAKKVDPNTNGSWGLVRKLVGKAAPAQATFYGTNISGTVSEGSVTCVDTPAKEGVKTSANISLTWDNPPSTLKPGQVVEIGVSATASVSEKDANILNITGWVSFRGGFEILEQTNAFVGNGPNGFIGSGKGKFKAKVPAGGSGELHIWKGQTGVSFGSGGNWYPCQYWYQWNAKPIEDSPGTKPDPKKDPKADEKEPKRTTTGITILEQDKEVEKKIKAKLDKASVTLRAGEPSEIVDLSISDFRTNTADRVEVVFPQATDGWASLPGQIVVGGGNGSYDPANMNRPVHTDGYFFSARSTAPDGKYKIECIVRQKGAGQAKVILEVTVIGRKSQPGDASKQKPWQGTWVGKGQPWSPLKLEEENGRVTGTIAINKGTLEGSFSEGLLEFTFVDETGKKGKGSFAMTTDKKLISGAYAYDDNPSKKIIVELDRS